MSESQDPPRPETLASSRGFDGKHLHLRVDSVRLPSGRESVREVVEHPGAVAVVAVTADGEVVLIRQFHHAIERTLLGIPAGTCEPGEPALETARRELLEETGYEAGPMRDIAHYAVSPGYTTEWMTIVLAEGCRKVGDVQDIDESIRVVTVPIGEIHELVMPGAEQIADAKSLIGLAIVSRMDVAG